MGSIWRLCCLGATIWSSLSTEVLSKNGVLKNFAIFTGKQLSQSLFFKTSLRLQPPTLSKKRLWHIYFSVKNFKNIFCAEHLCVTVSRCWLWTHSSSELEQLTVSIFAFWILTYFFVVLPQVKLDISKILISLISKFVFGWKKSKYRETTRSSRPKVFCKKRVLRNFVKFTGKHLCQRLF